MTIGAGQNATLLAVAVLVLVGCAAMALVAVRRPAPTRRDERGESGDGFMKGVVKVSLIVMLVAGALVWIVDRAEENDRRSDRDSRIERPDQPRRNGGDRD